MAKRFYLFLFFILGSYRNTPTLLALPAPEPVTHIYREGREPSISGDGRWLAYPCNSRRALCITDTTTGVTEEVVTIPSGDLLQHVDISRDGSAVAYWLRPGTNGSEQLFVYDRLLDTNELVSVNSDEEPGLKGNITVASLYSEPHISGDGRYVVFSSIAYNLVADDTNREHDVFVRDRVLGITTRVSLASNGDEGNEESGRWGVPPFISDDGQTIVFMSDAENLVPGDIIDDNPPYEYNYRDVFLFDVTSMSLRRISEVPHTSIGGNDWSTSPIVSPNGEFVAFQTAAQNIYNGPYSDGYDLVLYNRSTGSIFLVNKPYSGDPEYEGSDKPCDFNFDGSLLYFSSELSNLVPGDTPYTNDTFLYQNGSLKRILAEYEGSPLSIYNPSTTDSGNIVAFNTVIETDSGPVPRVGILDRGDIRPPQILNFSLVPGDNSTPVPQGAIVDILGVASDIGTGSTDLVSAEYQINSGAWMPLPAKDGTYDGIFEEFRGFLMTESLSPATHNICARATDAAGNTGAPQCTELVITDATDVNSKLSLECTHTPLWPQPGDTVEIRAATLNFDKETNAGIPPYPVQRIEIWFEDGTTPETVRVRDGVTSHLFTSESLAAGDFTYGCRAIDGENTLFSGWRTVAVGSPGEGAVPIMYTGASSDRVDIVFVADVDSYSGANDSQFQSDVADFIKFSYFRFPLFNRYQHLFNFWIAQNTGAADREDDVCTLTKPSDWDELYSFADAGGIIHTDTFRDCAKNGLFSSEPGSYRTLRHENGHRPFGLSDEYCCDTTYFIGSPFGNLYSSLEDCEEDAPNLGRGPESCREFTSDINDKTVYASDPDSNDLMVDNATPNASDIRRIEWVFDQCIAGKF